MSDSNAEEKTRLGLTKAEFSNLMGGVRYGVIIIITVGITFVIVALLSAALGIN